MIRPKGNKINRGSHTLDSDDVLRKKIIRNRLYDIIPLVIMVFSMSIVVVNLVYSNKSYIGKGSIKAEIFTVINNGGDLRTIRNVYENREILKWSISGTFRGYDDHYDYSVPVSKILEDIRSDFFLKVKLDGVTGGVYGYLDNANEESLARINDILQENEQVNPFEGLEPAQKDNFENIRVKLSDDYSLVAVDMEKLSLDLKTKNDLVSQYLKDSTTSFWVSVSALIFSLFVSIYQVYAGRDSRLKYLISSTMNEPKDLV